MKGINLFAAILCISVGVVVFKDNPFCGSLDIGVGILNICFFCNPK